MVKRGIFLILVSILLIGIIFAHEEESEGENNSTQTMNTLIMHSFWALFAAGGIAALAVVISLSVKPKKNIIKWVLFLSISIPIAMATIYLTYATVYLNVISETGGPVHWHADFEVIMCGEKKDLINAQGFSNLVGDPILHEHGDNRIHVEGVLVKKKDANMDSFFAAVGAFLNDDQFVFPTDSGPISVRNGEKCPDGKEGVLQAFVYQTHDKIVTQQKLSHPAHYILSPYSNVPPGDCIIIEFGEEKEKTEYICNSYKTAMQRGDLHGN